MANEFQLAEYTPSLSAIDAVVTNQAMQYLRNDTFVFESLTTANWSKYLFSMPEIVAATGDYAGNFPSGYATAGTFQYLIYNQAAGTSFANRVFTGYSGIVNWTGTAESFPLSSSAANTANVGMTGTTINATSSGGGGGGGVSPQTGTFTTSIATANTWSPFLETTLTNLTNNTELGVTVSVPSDGSSGTTISNVSWELWARNVASGSTFKIAGWDISNPLSGAANLAKTTLQIPAGNTIPYNQNAANGTPVYSLLARHKYTNNPNNVPSTCVFNWTL